MLREYAQLDHCRYSNEMDDFAIFVISGFSNIHGRSCLLENQLTLSLVEAQYCTRKRSFVQKVSGSRGIFGEVKKFTLLCSTSG